MIRFARWMAAAVAALASTGTFAAHDRLDVQLSAPTAVVQGDDDVRIDVAITNNAGHAVTVARWQLPSEHLQGPLLRILRDDGSAVRYTGPLIKRAAPGAKDLVTLQAGETLRATMELTGAYAIGNGRFTIEYIELGLREDGATELSCVLAGLPRAGAERTGADATHGAVRGRISFPTRPIPPMRVCAVSTGNVPGGWCAITAEGIGSYAIGSVPPGEYYLLAWPERDNPNRYVAAHAQRLAGCRPLDPNCANGVLERVYVHAGRVLENVDLDQAFTNLPPHLAKPPPLR